MTKSCCFLLGLCLAALACTEAADQGSPMDQVAGTANTSTAQAGAAGSSVGGSAGNDGATVGQAGAHEAAGAAGAPATQVGGGTGGAGGNNNSNAESGGAAGESAGAGGMINALGPSVGCGTVTADAKEEFLRRTWMQEVEPGMQQEREFFVRLPPNYDPNVPQRLMFLWTGCANPYENAPRTYQAPGADAIVVAPSRLNRCFASEPDSIDVEFFDYMLQFASEEYCVDQDRVFSAGHSSGSWMTSILGCQRSNVLRAQANISGGLEPVIVENPELCLTHPIAGIMVHDEFDPENGVAGGEKARDRLVALNGCGTDSLPVLGRPPCVEYQGCTTGYPVVWCETQNSTHDRQDELTIPAFWDFFTRF